MIRQAISCDICGTEMQHAHHWFVAYDKGTELRVSGWNARTRMRSGARHLCGQKCLHKLVDDFMARTLAQSSEPVVPQELKMVEKKTPRASMGWDGSLTSLSAHSVAESAVSRPSDPISGEFKSPARLIVPAETEKLQAEEIAAGVPSYASRAWRSQAWKREQEREQREASSTAGKLRRSIA